MVVWQDAVITIGTICFIVALMPSLLTKNKPSIWTSSFTGASLYVLSWTYFSLDLVFSAVVALVLAAEWTILAAQVVRLRQKDRLSERPQAK